MDSKGKWVYAPIDKKGDGRRFLEIYPDARESMINENNVKMKMAPGTSMSDGGWIKFDDPDFFASIYAGVTPAAKIAEKADGLMDLSKDELLEDYSQTTGEAVGETKPAAPSKNALAQNLLRQALGKPSADAETIKKLNDKENESKNCNS